MSAQSNRVLIIGQDAPAALELSYLRAFETFGCEVELFDMVQAVNRYVRLGKWGRLFNTFVPIEPWIRKANRELLHRVTTWRPHMLINFAQHPARVGTLAQMKASSGIQLVQLWPDTLVNWNTDLSACLPLYDLVAAHSKTTLPWFKQMGARRVEWVPLAGDPALHPHYQSQDVEPAYRAEVSFVGGWRPEREEVLSQLGQFDLKIWGPEWGRRCKNNAVIMRAWQKRAAIGAEFAKVVAGSHVNLNIIDFSNYPSANMRFFEIPTAGGLQVSSPCPEMEAEFRHGEHVLYYQTGSDLLDLIRQLLADEMLGQHVAQAAHELVMTRHTYTHRTRVILEQLEMRL
jgi:hypothetical protein